MRSSPYQLWRPVAASALSLARVGSRTIGILSVVALLVLWEILAQTGALPVRFLSSPSIVTVVGIDLVADGTLMEHLTVSAVEFVIGFLPAVAIGVTLAALIAYHDWIRAIAMPYVSFFYAVPRVALIPLLVAWFGIGLMAKGVLVFLMAVFPIVITMEAGLRNYDSDLARCSRSFGASRFQTFLTIVVPSAVPFLVTAMRLAMARALVGVVVAEMYAASSGIGYFIRHSGLLLQTDRVFVGIVILAMIGAVLMWIANLLESWARKYFPS
jgi:NitT/TauT family transport system permease protein